MPAKRKGPGGARPGSGRKPVAGEARSIVKTVKLTPPEYAATQHAAGDTPWTTWAHDMLVAAALRGDR